MPDTHVTIAGNLTDDPEVTFTPNGAAVTNFRLAVTARIKDGEGWRDGDTSFYRITAWRQPRRAHRRLPGQGQPGHRRWPAPGPLLGDPGGGAPQRGRGPGRGGRPLAPLGHRQARARHQRQAQAASSTTTRPSEPWPAVRPGRS